MLRRQRSLRALLIALLSVGLASAGLPVWVEPERCGSEDCTDCACDTSASARSSCCLAGSEHGDGPRLVAGCTCGHAPGHVAALGSATRDLPRPGLSLSIPARAEWEIVPGSGVPRSRTPAPEPPPPRARA